jgi:DNA invertase Pin-like site-specific DNA recombinase
MKPSVFGYMNVTLHRGPDHAENDRRVMTAFAEREGFAMEEIFEDKDANSPLSALLALIEAANRSDATAVVVPRLADLGRLPRVRAELAKRLQREGGLRVLVAQTLPNDVHDVDLCGPTTGRPEGRLA